MKRSQINRVITEDIGFIKQLGFCLPPFAVWTAADWRGKGAEYHNILLNGLGWDVADYGSGDFARYRIAALKIRGGNRESGIYNKPYAENLLILEAGQKCPMHFHPNKIEDLINRGGGDFLIALYNSGEKDGLLDTPVEILMDGRIFTVKAGEPVRVKPGESISLKPRQYHTFWAEDKKVLFGEVTMASNAHHFYGKAPGTTEIEEDEPKKYLLTRDYPERLK